MDRKTLFLGGVLALVLWPPGGHGQTTASSQLTGRAFTFDMPGVSYLDARPPLVTKQNLGWRFEFRTKLPNTFLFHHGLGSYSRRDHPNLEDYELYWEIKHGSLHVVHHLNGWQDEANIGIALSDDRWHRVWVTVDGKTGQATVRLDNQTLQMRPYGLASAISVLVWSNLTTVTSFGGSENPVSLGMQTFIGCMQDLQYLTSTGEYRDVEIQGRAGVSNGCVDLCSGVNPCRHGGQCVSQYTQTVCDCFGTGYEGATCQIPGSTVVTLNGYDWIVYRLYNSQEDWVNREKHRFSLEFKTQRGSGVLLYAMGTSPTNDHVIATLFGGSVHVAVSFGDDHLELNMGIGLDNSRWHNLTIHHQGSLVEVYLDGVVRRRRTRDANHYLSLDPNIYFGGGHNFVRTRGLKVTQNFVGCLRNVYVDEVAVLYNINKDKNNKTQYSGGRKIQLGCDPVEDPPITFPLSGTMVLVENEENARLVVQLEFRTVLHEAVLIHTELIAPDNEVGYDIGDLEVWISSGEVMLHFKPSSRFPNFTQDLSIGEKVNDAMWHSLQLTYVNRQVWLRLDGKQIISEKYSRPLNHRGNIVIGHGLRRYKSGFVGCMRRLKIQGRTIDPLVMVQSKQAVGVVLDGCDLKDRCKGLRLCQHDSLCVSDWEGVVCDCTRVPYVGKTCHFANYLRTCDEYYQAGWRGSGVYRIDPDGNGPLSPVYVNCDMEHMVAQEGYGLTVIEHNLPKNFTAREIGEPGRKVKISYRGVDRFALKALTGHSLRCRQHISYQCKDAKLSLGKLTWFKTTDGQVLDYLGTTEPGDCQCANNNNTCLQPGTACNCDTDLHQWSEDRGFNTIKEQLPITEMVFLKDKGQGVVTLGPLECWGNVDHRWETAVTFKTSESYLTAPAWSTGDLEVSFKTDKSSATLLHQSSPQTSGDFLTMTLLEDHKLEISYSVGRVERRIVLRTKAAFSSGLWNQVRVEHDRTNARFTLNEASEMIDLQKGERLARFKGAMFIGSPGTKLAGSNSGIIGCVRGVVYNNKLLNLVEYAEEKSEEVEAGCTASCQSSPCQHGATCEEAWGQYKCHCLNTWSHLGSNCQQNIDENMATIDGAKHSYLEVNVTTPKVLSGTIVFSFRTFQANALLFYMHDHFSNFIQLELRNAREILLLYNSLTYIIDEFIQVRDLNDGNWKQVIIEKLDNGWTKLQCGKISRVIQQKRALLKTYLSKPFNSRESVQPIRGELPPSPFLKLYVGGVPMEMKSKITPATLHGCVRGFRSNEYIFDLEGSAESQNGTSVGCIAGCEKQGCQNGGRCVELWEGEYQCDCVNSYYSGITCQTEPSGIFDGNTVVKSQVKLDATSLAASTSTERLTVHFTANSTANTERVVLAFVYSSRTGDYILVYLTRLGDVVVETDLGTGTYIVKKSGSFVDDQRHKLEYKRRQTELSLTLDPYEGNKSSVIDLSELDRDRPSTVVHPDYTLDRVDTIMVGGVVLNNPRFSDYHNFTGCLSDVVYYPLANSVLNFQPLKELHQVPEPDTVETWGEEPVPCSPTPPVMEKPQQEIPSSPSGSQSRPEIVTMPPWDRGPAEVELIQPVQTPNVTNQTQIVPVITESTDYLTIIIAVTLVAFLLIVALVIALLLARIRRRHERYNIQKQPAEYHELKKPLKGTELLGKPPAAGPVTTSHLATMDEFSLVSGGTLDQDSPQNHHEANGYHFPEMSPEDEALLNPPLNRKTNRPASSISEVLEEMERRRKAKAAGRDPDVVVLTDSPVSAQSMQMHGEGDLEWDPQMDKVPLSCIFDYSDEFSEASSSRPSVTEAQIELTVGDSPPSQHRQKKKSTETAEVSSHHSNSPVRVEFNGDSGYEAGSKPEVEEENTDKLESSDKLYKYDLAGCNSESLLKGDSVKTRLISEEAETAC